MTKDTIYQDNKGPFPFSFDRTVTQVFDDMVHRSIPHYEKNLHTIVTMAKHYAAENNVCYDLGCSLGKLSILLSQAELSNSKIIAVDNSSAMLESMQDNLKTHKLHTPVETVQANLNDVTFHQKIAQTPSSIVILNYTLQFLKTDMRLSLLRSIRESLSHSPKGILILCEKVKQHSVEAQDLFDQLYYEFKLQKGYHNLEISRKREALENVLVADTVDEHQARLTEAGFKAYELWHKHWHFTAWVAWV